MSWNYRVCKRLIEGESYFTIHECYYLGKNSKVVTAWTVDACGPWGDTLKGLKNDLEYMRQALNLPVVDLDRLDKRFKKKNKSETDGGET